MIHRILLIDDDPIARHFLEIELGELGWVVVLACSPEQGLEKAKELRSEIILLDIVPRNEPRTELLRLLLAISSVPIIIVSDLSDEAAKIELLNAGADDYITKPFHFNILVARIEAILRRRRPEKGVVFKSGDLEVDLAMRLVRLGQLPIKLSPTEYELLSALVERAGGIVSRETLFYRLWGSAGDPDDGNLRVYIRLLRQKLEKDPSHPRLIITEQGLGYRLELLPPSSAPSEAPAPSL